MINAWSDVAWSDYLWWQESDREAVGKINRIIKAIEREPFGGMGKPEALTGNYSGLWSRRIDRANRIIYRVEGETLFLYSAKDHYGDH